MLHHLHRKVVKPLISVATLDFVRNPRAKVAVLPMKGIIGDLGRLRSRGLTLNDLKDSIDKAFSLPGLKAVCLQVNSPGGSPVQSSLIYEYVRSLAEEKDITVLSFAEDVCASGGYWLACAGDEIYAHPASIVGSVGVVAAGFGLSEFISRHGIERRVYTQGENKAMLDPFLPEDQEDIDRLLSVQRDVHTSFKELVKMARGKRLNADADELFSGAFWSGLQAKDMGLVDGLGDLHSVTREKFGKKVKLITVTPSKPFLSGLFSSKTANAHWTQEALNTVEERGYWQRFGL